MSSKQILTLAQNPFIKEFTLQIIKKFWEQKFDYRITETIDAELVPKVVGSKKPSIMAPPENFRKEAQFNHPIFSLKKKIKNIQIEKPPIKPKIIPKKTAPVISFKKIIPIAPAMIFHPVITMQTSPITEPPVKIGQKQQMLQPLKPLINTRPKGQEKLSPLLNDPLVYLIECPGAGKPLVVLNRGQKQLTKIVMTEEEIRNFLKKISDSTHIPLLEGVFRAVIGKISINAIISKIIGSKFLIKKHII